ncbi:hypothetical protein KQX54_013139 [Cotesia glomerata]|uniref:Uncharacterized protein n=1 Tax=Cotesia glomerata TaxID=32391 RepID=A0AAV7I4J5_COTGL|nr:hypothetical protein KQX54_013139 [Cotesia glomerata]
MAKTWSEDGMLFRPGLIKYLTKIWRLAMNEGQLKVHCVKVRLNTCGIKNVTCKTYGWKVPGVVSVSPRVGGLVLIKPGT